ncbi:TPA: hypothetical protein ACXNHL_002659 [Serratia marcescens]
MANSLIISKACAAGGWEAKLGGSLSLKVPTKAANSRTPGMQKEKGHTANAPLWDGCFSSHEENQQSTVLGGVVVRIWLAKLSAASLYREGNSTLGTNQHIADLHGSVGVYPKLETPVSRRELGDCPFWIKSLNYSLVYFLTGRLYGVASNLWNGNCCTFGLFPEK